MFQFNRMKSENGQQFVTVFANGMLKSADDSHPNFDAILAACETAIDVPNSVDLVLDLMDVAAAVERRFQQLTDRVAVRNGVITLDNDPVHGTLQDQILSFIDADEDFGPLVAFYEKLLTNPLGDVRDGVYDWIQGQTKLDTLTITEDGDLLGYKSVTSGEKGYRPSRAGEGIVNGVEVGNGEYIWQNVGDVIEMPRSRVLNAPSQQCGDGLHIGTWAYASGFQGDTVLLVRFSPRDIVSLPDSNSTWKLRVCRYTVVEAVTEPLAVPVYLKTEKTYDYEVPSPVSTVESEIQVGSRVQDADEDIGVVTAIEDDNVTIDYSESGLGVMTFNSEDEGYGLDDLTLLDPPLVVGDRVENNYRNSGTVTSRPTHGQVDVVWDDAGTSAIAVAALTRIHGAGGSTSEAAKGRGKNPAQDDLGRFSNGRPGSTRDSSTGRFS